MVNTRRAALATCSILICSSEALSEETLRGGLIATSSIVPAQTAAVPSTLETIEQTPEDLLAAYWCLTGGSLAMAAAFAFGAENTNQLVAGGVVPAQSQATLYLALFAVTFAAFCSISESLVPIYTYHSRTQEPRRAAQSSGVATARASESMAVAPYRVSFQAGTLGRVAASASRRMAATAFANNPRTPPGEPQVLVAQEPDTRRSFD